MSQPGDYNNDGRVDAADYTVWRDGGPLANETLSPGEVNNLDYDAWAANYGQTSGTTTAAVPEPSVILLAVIGAITVSTSRR